MNHTFDVADYAIDHAVEMATDAEMKGPWHCDDFYDKMEEAIRLMREAQTVMHLHKEEAKE